MAIINNTWSIEHFQLKYHKAEDWSADYVLAAGEPGVEIDTGKAKLGDGVKKWSELEYYSDPVLKALITEVQGKVSTLESDMTQAKSDISTLLSDMSTAKSDISTAKSDIETLQNKVAAIEGISTISVNPLLAGE